MGTYNLPRSVKGEGRILFIFSKKAFIFTMGCGFVGFLFYLLFSALRLKVVGIVILIIFALIGFVVGTCKMPNLPNIKWANKNAGENIDDIIIRAFKFNQKGKKIYMYKGGKDND